MTAAPATFECTACGKPLSVSDAAHQYGALCNGCGVVSWLTLFPAAFEDRKTAHPEAIVDAAEASCFYHAAKRAHVTCDGCGRFLCKLCQIELGGENLCPACIEAGRRKGTLSKLDNHRVMYDSIALALATLPVMGVWTVLVGAPASLYLSIRYWRKPLSIVRRTKVRFVIAILFALAELGGIAAIVVGLVLARNG